MTRNQVYLLCLLIGLMIGGCSEKECSVCPDPEPPVEEKDYHFLYSYGGRDGWVYTYSTKTMTVLDSVAYGQDVLPFWDLKYTSDGRYAVYTRTGGLDNQETWVTDYVTGDTISSVQGIGGMRLSISHDNSLVAVALAGELTIYTLPQLGHVFTVDNDKVGICRFHPRKNVIYGGFSHLDSLFRLDLEGSSPSLLMIPFKGLDGDSLVCTNASVTLDGEYLITNGVYPHFYFGYCQLRDPSTLEIRRQYVGVFGDPVHHPDGSRVFMWVAAGLGVLDLQTLLYERVFDPYNVVGPFPWHEAIEPTDGELTPDGRHLVFCNDTQDGFGDGPIIKLDLETYKIVGTAYPRRGRGIAVGMYPLEFEDGDDNEDP